MDGEGRLRMVYCYSLAMNPKLSIITINFNNRDGLQKTIDSVIAQSFRDFEWIVIDGGSTDGSRELIERYSTRFSYWVSEHDKGVYNAMNKGIKVAKGEYLLFLNSGDWLYDDRVLQTILGKEHTADILYGYMLIEGNGTICHAAMMKPVLYWTDFIGNTLPHQASFIRRALFEKYGLYDESYRIAGDVKFFIKAIVWEKATYEFIPEKVAVFQSGGISSDSLRFEERDVRLRNEMFPKMVVDDYKDIVTLRRIKNNRVLRKFYTLLSKVAEKVSR